MADKYDVPRLRALVVSRLDTVCDPRKDEIDFVEALRVVDGCTANNTIWDILLPKAKANLQTLLKNEIFKEVVKEQSALTFQLLSSFASSSQDQSSSAPKSHAVADAEAPDPKRPRVSGDSCIPRAAPFSATPTISSPTVQSNDPTPLRFQFEHSLSGRPFPTIGYPQPGGAVRGGPSMTGGARGGLPNFPDRGRGRGRGRGS